MTKRRAPLTCELALTKVAGQVGWEQVAFICGQCESAVRKWSDPDCAPAAEDRITMAMARRLDVAFKQAGGDGAPMHEFYTTRLKADAAEACSSAEALMKAAATAAKESGEANAALFVAARPGATDADLAIAERELEESITAQTHTLATLRAGRKGEVPGPGGPSDHA